MNEVLIDIEGNNYKTVKIGKQIWMAENLKCSHYKNGDQVLISKNHRQCSQHLLYGESAVYISKDDSSEYQKYGLLYSPKIMLDARAIAPEGWHIPRLDDWKELVTYSGGEDVAGRKLKSVEGWKREKNQPRTYGYKICEFGGTNDFGFSSLPSGKMDSSYQNAIDVGMYAHYWAAEEQRVSNDISWYGFVNLNYYNGNINMGVTYTSCYRAIRCVKNV